MIGRTVLHYKILSPLGSGGMGVVYLAEDERLGRQVALKFLPASWLQEPVALERFRVEARAASALSHPGICTIYDIGNDGDSPFIVMEALKGETLRERIARGALRVQEILEIGAQLTDALDAAHSRGIVHRDIKPANIFLGEKNRVKVLDFGLAKLGASPSAPPSLTDSTTFAMLRAHQMTTPGTAVGTVSYMSPEQARGDDVDTRTDLFSVGAVLYEMATGVQAFGGNSIAVIFDGILNRTPKRISQLNPLIPSQIEAVVAKALEKDRELRYQHASDLHAELKRIRRDLDGSSFVTSQAGLTAARDAAVAATATQSQAIIPSRGRWYKTGAVATLVVVTVGIWAWLDRRGSEESAGTPVAVQDAVARGETPAETPAAVAPAAPPALTGPAPGRTVEPADPQRAPARSERPQPSQPVETSRPELRPAPTPVGGATLPEQPATSPPTNTATVPAPTIPSASAAEPPASTSTARDTAPPPNQTPPPAVAPPAPAAEGRAGATPSIPAPVPQKPDISAPSPAKPSVAPIDDEAAIRGVLRSYEQAIETKDLALFRSIRPRLTPAEEALLRNSFQQVDSQEVTIRVESLNIDGRVATVRIFRQDTLVFGGRRQTQSSTQTLQFEKTASGWVIN